MSRHIIHKQQITLNLPKQEGAYAFQNRVSALLHNELSANMETVFDELFPDGEIIRIDALKLDLGNINPQNFEQEFKEHFIQELRKNLSSKKDIVSDTNNEEILTSAQSLTGALIYFLENGYLPWYSSVEKMIDWEDEILISFSGKKDHRFFNWLSDSYKDNPVVLQRLILQFTDNFLEQLLLVMAPVTEDSWNLIYGDLATILGNCIKGGPQLRSEIWKYLFHAFLNKAVLLNKDALSGDVDSKMIYWALKLLTEHFGISGADITRSTEVRISKQLKTGIVKNAFLEIKLLLATQNSFKQKNGSNPVTDNQENTETYYADKTENDYSANDQKNLKIDPEDKIEKDSSLDNQKNTQPNCLDKTEKDCAANDQNNLEIDPADITGGSIATDDLKNRKTLKSNNDADDLADRSNERQGGNELINREIQADNLTGNVYKNENKEKPSREASSKNKKQNGIPELESLYIKSSGIVILHYFLKPFFTDLKFLNDKGFINDTAHQRAVLLLHYLATGDTEAAEFDLTLQKILCGYPLDETLPASIILSKKEKMESKKLLEAIVAHWVPMKNTSVNGLRDAFLMRDGKLITKENSWLLTVEHRTIDVLLGKLPWGFSIIRLPWMQQILNVDWY
ncbi:MAG: hypothetical protein JWR38_5781 [Mucilaginibacter sp.]|nr:hypothetical protein [Mucilaginibacter sp.]